MRASSYRLGGEDWDSLFRSYDRDGAQVLQWQLARYRCNAVRHLPVVDSVEQDQALWTKKSLDVLCLRFIGMYAGTQQMTVNVFIQIFRTKQQHFLF